uniref:Protein-serine/threonine phosphatase n=1 Tax=Cyclophora tenuis TaxID=216820 RepID=A0A7S1GQG5_CYCTE
MDPDPAKLTTVVRPVLEQLARDYNATITQALPTMLEVLPPNCSKLRGVEELCKQLSKTSTTTASSSSDVENDDDDDLILVEDHVLALGDAENDMELLKKASIGVAMGNASPPAQDAADFVMTETNNEGGAGAALQVFLFGQY